MAKARRVIETPAPAPGEILRLALDGLSHYACVTLDSSGVITSWNRGAERLLGHSRESAVGRHISSFHGSTDGSAIGLGDLERASREGPVSRAQIVCDSEGQPRHAQLTLVAVTAQHGAVGYAIVAHAIGARPTAEDAQRQLSESATLLAAEIADRTQAEAARDRLLRRLVVAQEDERRRIARDLHDDLGQRLTALRLVLEGLEKAQPGSGPSAETTVALQMLAGIDQHLDFIAWELRPAALDELGLVKVLETYVEEWSRHAAIPAAFHARPGQLHRFAPEVEASIYRIAQEALNNVAKHAGASAVNVLLELRGENIALIVEDDGRGFHPTASSETMIGVTGMRERALAVGGTLEIEPTPQGGTTVLACIPTALSRFGRSRQSRASDAGADPGAYPLHLPDPADPPRGSTLTAIRARLQELQRAVGARDEFIATVAHELRNPIAPLTFQVRLALNKAEQVTAQGATVPMDWVRAQLRGIEQRLHRLLETLDRLLDVSRLSSGRLDLQLEPVDLAAIVREVLDSLEAELAAARCKVTLTERGSATGSWDRLRVEQICRNLFSNAVRFGAGRPIEVSIAADHDFATVQVRDHGIGIARDQQSRLFERFERGADQRTGGFGIGLWVVRNLCLAMGGDVSVESELGEGACFTVMLPRRSVREANIAGTE